MEDAEVAVGTALVGAWWALMGTGGHFLVLALVPDLADFPELRWHLSPVCRADSMFAREGGKVALEKKKKGAIKIGSISAKVRATAVTAVTASAKVRGRGRSSSGGARGEGRRVGDALAR